MNKVIVVVGPTAVGKTKISIELAKHYGLEIISGDSVAVYKGLDIGSAKPSLEERDGIVHHLLDVLEPNEQYNVADFQKSARSIMDKNKVSLICGGTGLYVQAAIQHYQNFYIPAKPRLAVTTARSACTIQSLRRWKRAA